MNASVYEEPSGKGTILSILDLGSNSLRMLIARINAEGSVIVLNQVKHMVRLGEGSFEHNRLQPESMSRTLEVLRGLAEMCAAYRVREVLAFATAAVRDASNGQDFLRVVREKTGLDFVVISGREEARLIYRGVSSGLTKTETLRLFIDIGGGSTELVVGNSYRYEALDSLKLGCVRLANHFFAGDDSPVSEANYAALQKYIRNDALHVFQRMESYAVTEFVASSGTAQNLAEMAAAFANADGVAKDTPSVLTYSGLRRVVRELCARTEAERKTLPGINPRRVGVLIPGAAILQTIMEELGADSVLISNLGLRNGILADFLEKNFPHTVQPGLSIREESVLKLARFCHYEEEHSRHVAALAVGLFDSVQAAGLRATNPVQREVLYFAGLLHDIGIFIAFSRHHAHSYYLIRNSELVGFTEREIAIIAATAYFHRVKASKKDPLFTALEEDSRQEVRLLSLLLTLAECMDKSHCQVIRSASFSRNPKGKLELRLDVSAPCPVELDRLQRSQKLLDKYWKEPVGLVCYTVSSSGVSAISGMSELPCSEERGCALS